MTELLLILLGAGASKVLGIPTMVEFTDAVLARLETERKQLAQSLLGNLQRWSNNLGVTADLEGLLAALRAWTGQAGLGTTWPQVAAFQALTPNWSPERAELANETIKQIEVGIATICQNINLEKAATLYYDLFRNLSTNVLIDSSRHGTAVGGAISRAGEAISPERIFTTNYDMGVETFLTKYGYPTSDGFGQDPRHGDLTLQMEWGNPDGQFQLFKLHGSINYYRDEEGRIVKLKGPPKETFLQEQYHGQLMIFPTEENYVTRTPFHDLFLRFRETLAREILVLIIGSSLRDQPIRNAIEDIVPYKKSKMIIVAPRATQIAQTFSKGVRNRCVIMNAKFGNPGFVNELNRAISERRLGETVDYLRD